MYCIKTEGYLTINYKLVVGHRLEIIMDHQLASVDAADAIFRL